MLRGRSPLSKKVSPKGSSNRERRRGPRAGSARATAPQRNSEQYARGEPGEAEVNGPTLCASRKKSKGAGSAPSPTERSDRGGGAPPPPITPLPSEARATNGRGRRRAHRDERRRAHGNGATAERRGQEPEKGKAGERTPKAC